MEGDQVEFRKKIAKMVFDAGHEVGGHSYSHPNFYFYKKDDYRQFLSSEIDKAGKLIEGATGKKPHIMRMPYGYSKKDWVKEVAKEKGYVLVNWTFGCDWKKMSGDELAKAYIKNIGSGAIFLMHDGGKGRGPTVEALPKIIEEIQKRGYKLVTIGEMLGLNDTK
jgi:peptidoglycan/xylan/chitin deacetylase (PgdA/CDA1 family)